MSIKRHLAVMMITDILGYTQLMGLDEENSHFVDGMTEDIPNNLSEIDSLSVTSRML